MKSINQKQNKKIWTLAVISILASVLLSFFGAPFLRALSVSTKSRFFWSVGALLVFVLILAGTKDSQFFHAAVYVGAIWMTLGSYNELEKRGVSWKLSGVISLTSGALLAGLGFLFVLNSQTQTNLLTEAVEPLQIVLKKAFPENPIETSVLVGYLPGMFVASLFAALALGFLLEAKVVNMFQLRREKVASGLRWLEFRLPDAFIWVSLFALLFSVVGSDQKVLQTVSINLTIISAVAYFFQGITVVEFTIRMYRMGSFSRAMLYLLIFFQLTPFIVFLGLVDYWADFRKLMRRKAKAN